METTQHPVKKFEAEDNCYEVSIYDKENPYSIIEMVPEWFVRRVEGCSKELLGMEEQELREKLKPTQLQNKLRMAFWVEYDMACRTGRKMDIRRVYAGLCSKENFVKTVCRSNTMAWILTPVSSYKTSLEEALETGIAQLRKMLEAPLYKDDGTLDTAAANVVIKVFTLVEQRVHGSIVQKSEVKSLVVQKHVKEGGGGTKAPAIDIDEKLRVIQNQLIQNNKLVMGVPSGPTEKSEQES